MTPFGEYHRTYAMARALENRIVVAYNNRVGAERDINFCGGSCAAAPDCRWLIEGSSEPGLYTCHVNLAERKMDDPALDYFAFRRPELYRLISDETIRSQSWLVK
jgi:predicted amidohydrolase